VPCLSSLFDSLRCSHVVLAGLAQALKLLNADPHVKCVLVNIFGYAHQGSWSNPNAASQ